MITDDPTEHPYAWTEGDHSPLGGGATAALARGKSPISTLEILGADRAVGPGPAVEIREWVAAQDFPEVGTALEAEVVGDWTLVVEFNGYRATDLTLFQRLSQGAEAILIYSSVNADMQFMYARDGVILRNFDPMLDDSDDVTTACPRRKASPSQVKTASFSRCQHLSSWRKDSP